LKSKSARRFSSIQKERASVAEFLASLPLGKILPAGLYGASGAGVILRTIAAQACVLVAGRDSAAVIAKARSAFAIELCDAPRLSAGGGIEFIGLGPGRWLVLSAQGDFAGDLATRLEAACEPEGSIFDQSGGLVILEAEGKDIGAVLAKLVAIDLHPSVFAVGAAATTTAAHVNLTLWLYEEGRWRFALGRSYLAAFLRAFSCSAAEFGLDWKA
jgi:sarcosine oxidase subunit gamma